jgi:hypothetical protein
LGSISSCETGAGGFSLGAATGSTDPTITRLHPPSNAAAVNSAHPRRHHDATISAIVSSAGLEPCQARAPDRGAEQAINFTCW